MLVAAGPLVTIATPGRPVAHAYPLAMWPAPCSWRTRMWRIELSMSGSYTGRMAPPGRPNMTSTPSISRLLMRAWAPVSFMASSGVRIDIGWTGVRTERRHEKPLAVARGESARREARRRALHNYENERQAARRVAG